MKEYFETIFIRKSMRKFDETLHFTNEELAEIERQT
jgi:hypothetical protein